MAWASQPQHVPNILDILVFRWVTRKRTHRRQAMQDGTRPKTNVVDICCEEATQLKQVVDKNMPVSMGSGQICQSSNPKYWMVLLFYCIATMFITGICWWNVFIHSLYLTATMCMGKCVFVYHACGPVFCISAHGHHCCLVQHRSLVVCGAFDQNSWHAKWCGSRSGHQ